MQEVVYTLECTFPVAQSGDVGKVMAAAGAFRPRITAIRIANGAEIIGVPLKPNGTPYRRIPRAKKTGRPYRLNKDGSISKRGRWARPPVTPDSGDVPL